LKVNNSNLKDFLAQPTDTNSKNEMQYNKSRAQLCQNCQILLRKPSINPKDTTNYQIDQANKENERTLKKLMMDVQKY